MDDHIDKTKLEEIPQPPQHLFGLLGNLPDVDPGFPSRSFMKLRELYGPIYQLQMMKPMVLMGSHELCNELFDQDRFKKVPQSALLEIRALAGDGLFTAYLEEPNWGKAHRLLTPIFGPLGIRKMFDGMLDISSQLVLKWDRQGPDHVIDPADDFTRLAFDTIGLCAMNYRFNEFYSDHAHPFAHQMVEVLIESGKRAVRTSAQKALFYRSEQERQENVRKMHQLCDEIIEERRKHPRPDLNDVLNVMIDGVDKETGDGLGDENIRYQMATLLVAGHETTSSTLSFLWYNLTKNPDKMHKAQQEVDEIVGDKVLTLDMLSKLDYVDACIKETQRISPTISQISVTSTKDQVIGGKYFIPKDRNCVALLGSLHTDPVVWGDDAHVFRPERFLNGGFQALPPNSWKPFGNGLRACIGRAFAEQEMKMNTALLLQRFQVEMANPNYELELKSTLTVKPYKFTMKVRRRLGTTLMTGIPGGIPSETAERHKAQHEKAHAKKSRNPNTKCVSVFFGGNMGTCEAMAQQLAEQGAEYGLQIEIKGLDAATENLPTDHAAVIISASYEGEPPDNARKFVSWLEQLSSGSKKLPDGTKFTVFGVGNSDWASTFHRIPKLVDRLMGQLGGERITDAGYSDAKKDLIGPWEDWSEKLLKTLSAGSSNTPMSARLEVTIESNKLPKTLGGDEMAYSTIIKNDEIADTSVGPAKRQMDVRLPEGTTYVAGDYLVVQAKNPDSTIRRALQRFGLTDEDLMTVKDTKKSFLPTTPTSVSIFLRDTVELASPITKRQLAILAEFAESENKQRIEEWQSEAKYQEVLNQRYSIIDVLEEFVDLKLPFSVYIDMLQPLTPRQYSISSSPLSETTNPGKLENADVLSITYDVHTSPARSGHGIFAGVASTYLATRRLGDRISCFVRPTNVGFRIPSDTEVPLILIAAGTGIAPMRAFLQERAAIKSSGVRKLGPAMLFFGCRSEEKDFIYRDELGAMEKDGIVQVITAFSRPQSGKGRYVSDALWEHRHEVVRLFKAGGKIFLCGSAARLGKSTADTCKKIYMDELGNNEAQAEEWLSKNRTERYVSDVY